MKTNLGRICLPALALAIWVLPVSGAVVVTPTTDTNALAAALNPQGLTIIGAGVEAGITGQFGTYTNFTLPPVTIANGVVLSSGQVSHVSDPPDAAEVAAEPSYSMGGDSTPEFDAYGVGHIDNFSADKDVAVLRVDFNLATNSQVKFDFIFGSVEFPHWTSEFTDALLVFLDGTDPTNQITFDANGQPVQVGKSFAGAVETDDRNTTFANPHGLLGRLTTTTPLLAAGNHTLRFEVGDVNDDLLDSAAFIANLRAAAGPPGTVLDWSPELTICGPQGQSGVSCFQLGWTNRGVLMVLERAGDLAGPWRTVSDGLETNGNIVTATVTNDAVRQYFRLREP